MSIRVNKDPLPGTKPAPPPPITTPINSEPLYSGYLDMDEEHTRVPQIADSEGLDALVEKMRGLLIGAVLQLEYLDERFPTGTTPGVIAQINHALEASSLPLRGL